METERFNLSKKFISKYSQELKKIIDINLEINLSLEEEILLINTSLFLKYKIVNCAKKVSKKNLIISVLKFLFK
jgi:hypothetical protein